MEGRVRIIIDGQKVEQVKTVQMDANHDSTHCHTDIMSGILMVCRMKKMQMMTIPSE